MPNVRGGDQTIPSPAAAGNDDQIEVLRELWTKPAVTLKTPYHTITDAGINPLPVQKPIPIWFGGGGMHPVFGTPNVDKVVRRVARLGDGWLPSFGPDEAGTQIMETFRGYCREYGRDPSKIGLEGQLLTSRKSQDKWSDTATAWKKFGATHFSINTMLNGEKGAHQHLLRLEEGLKALPKGFLA
jgi:alkanesulfonate monooxygenase SsuD/methylene tetrahydromethanopterin reductase-like flavin-dependent oxidoreductase (luciferase family)